MNEAGSIAADGHGLVGEDLIQAAEGLVGLRWAMLRIRSAGDQIEEDARFQTSHFRVMTSRMIRSNLSSLARPLREKTKKISGRGAPLLGPKA